MAATKATEQRSRWKPAEECKPITLIMRAYYENHRERARLYQRDPAVRARKEARRKERMATDPEFVERQRENARRCRAKRAAKEAN